MPITVTKEERDYKIDEKELKALLGIGDAERIVSFNFDRNPEKTNIIITTTTGIATKPSTIGGYSKS